MSSGYGSYGQMGNDSTSSINVFPVKALSSDKKTHLTDVAAVTADTYSSAALLKDGTIRAWGYGSYGQLGDTAFSNASVPVAVLGDNIKGEAFKNAMMISESF